eukprot:gnl/MRDRNA2_/MRDRNA2_83135_c1_seq3.p1 gnl/MRDRNA2_/MRDRNA2_83135_c1~~gnl/MRDRNA2_/MRDRNA2_83135_c1_seq3.p1  ORF type:complete len:100 (-),score=9.48 gnl/MRDRNA2_/MRDRNA2_83135_c1_seq3:385-684(-)
MVTRDYVLKFPMFHSARLANAANKSMLGWPVFTSTLAVPTNSCISKLITTRSARCSSDCKRCIPVVTNAHAVLASYCELKSSKRRSAALDNNINSYLSL